MRIKVSDGQAIPVDKSVKKATMELTRIKQVEKIGPAAKLQRWLANIRLTIEGGINMAVTIINRDNFEEKVLKADKPVILDLWASWCGPCKMLAPVVEELSEAHPEVLVGKVNVDEEPELADRFGVTAIPMLVLVKNGEVAKTAVGYQSRQQLEEALLG